MIGRTLLASVALLLPQCGPDAHQPPPIPTGRGRTYLYGEREPHPTVTAPDQLNLVLQATGKAAKRRCERDYLGVYGLSGTIPICFAVVRETGS